MRVSYRAYRVIIIITVTTVAFAFLLVKFWQFYALQSDLADQGISVESIVYAGYLSPGEIYPGVSLVCFGGAKSRPGDLIAQKFGSASCAGDTVAIRPAIYLIKPDKSCARIFVGGMLEVAPEYQSFCLAGDDVKKKIGIRMLSSNHRILESAIANYPDWYSRNK